MPKSSLLMAMALLLCSAIAVSAWAQQAAPATGTAELNLLTHIIGGNFGLFVGLIVTALGVWTFFIRNESGFGLFLIVVGALITFVPTLYYGVRLITCPIANSLGAKCNVGSQDQGGRGQAQQ